MTDGSSQGLFIVVAVVIFGIFVLLSYILFRDTMKPSLGKIYCDSFNQVEEDTELGIFSKECDSKFSNSFTMPLRMNIGFVDLNTNGSTPFPAIYTKEDPSMRTINLSSYSSKYKLNIENDEVEIFTIGDNGVTVTQEAIDKGFGKNFNRKGYFSINGQKEVYLGSSDFPNLDWGQGQKLKLKIGKINTIKITYVNIYGGKTTYQIQVKIINE